MTSIVHFCGAVSAAAIALGGGYAVAQKVTTVEELTVVGKPTHGPPEEFDYRVGYSDLNLRSEAGRKELANRIQIAATYACKKVDDPSGACRAEAVRNANARAADAAHRMRAHGEHPVPGSNWVPPPN